MGAGVRRLFVVLISVALFAAPSAVPLGPLARAIPPAAAAAGPDLIVTNFAAPPVVVPGGTASYTWTIRNQGDATANAVVPPTPPPYAWGDQVWLSTTPTSIAGAAAAGGIIAVRSLAPGESYTRSFSATVPSVAPGDYFFILQTDSANQIAEGDETNNLFAVPVIVTSGPQTFGQIAPAQPNPPAGSGCSDCTQFQSSTDAASPSYAAPFSGTITTWRVQGPTDTCPGCAAQLRIFRSLPSGEFLVVAQSARETVTTGLNTFSTSIAVQAGDRLGVNFTNGIRWYLSELAGDSITHVVGDPTPGTTTTGECGDPAVDFCRFSSLGPGYLTNVDATLVPSASIIGIARCDNGDGTTLLAGGTVELFSGSVLVGSTTADGTTGAYLFFGSAPNSLYRLRYAKTFVVEPSAVTIRCETTVTTDALGNGVGGPGTYIPNNGNHTWVTALQIASGVPVQDFVFEEGQSTWFKIPIARGQRVTVSLTNVPADLSLALYKDIGQIFAAELAALTDPDIDPLTVVNEHDASVAPDALSPDALSPDELSPDELSPDALSPDALSPDELSPDELSPDELSPDELSPDALSPDALSPDALSPDELSPDELSAAYAGAQTAALIGVSAHIGLSAEQISRNTWDNTGFFYMRVRGANGAFNASAPFTLVATAVDNQCGPVSLVDHPQTATVAGTNATTLIVTNTARLAGDTVAFGATLAAFAARPDVHGVVVDLGDPAWNSFDAAYAQWDAHEACPSAANIVAHSIKFLIRAHVAANPGLRYVVIAGNDDVVPFFRQPDQSGLGNEKDYFPAVQDPTASQAALRLGYVLTQDFYGSLRPISRFDHELYLPDLAVGRLVETIEQMAAQIDAFVAAGGNVAATRALVAGYDFLSDAATFIAGQLRGNALTVDDALVQPVGDSATDPTAWSGDQLKAKLFGTATYQILSLNAHFSANSMLAADYATRVLTSDIAALAATDTRFRGALVLSTGCHSGYGIVNGDQTALTDPLDWAQAFAARGATLIGGTGYQYGDTDFIKYTELLLANTTLELRYGTGSVPIGDALVRAKRTYVASLAALGGIDEKAVAQLTLYGLPMLGYELPAAARLARPAAPSVGTITPGDSAGLSVADLSLTNTLTRNERTLAVVGGGTETAIWYDAAGNVAVQPGAPVLPLISLDAAKTGQAVRGAVLLGATYADEAGVVPFTDVATTEVRGVHPRYVTDVFTPVRPFDLNHFAGAHFVSTPFQFRSAPGQTTGTGRRYLTEQFRLYYSSLTDARALAAAPTVYTVGLEPDGAGNVTVTVVVGGLLSVGIEDVFATFTGEAGPLHGTWASTAPLTSVAQVARGDAFARTYTGSIPLGGSDPDDLRVVIQAVGGNGLVTWASDHGAYYRVPDETATSADPKTATALSLTVPASGAYRTTVPVSAVLTAGGAPLAGKPVAFRSGGIRVNATTDASGVASARLFLASAPGTATVTVGFAEDAGHLASGARTEIAVTKAPTSFATVDVAPFPLGGSVLLATLKGNAEPLGSQPVVLSGGGRTVQTFTDGYGRVRLDTADGFPSGAYWVTIAYAGNDRYLPAAAASVLVVVFDTSTFVTGGGWFATSGSVGLPDGRKANFGASIKFKPGTTTPAGNLEFQLREAGLTLKATSFEWLAVGSGRADALGRGTLNGAAGWSFVVTLVDGSPDRFEIVIWNDATGSRSSPSYATGGALGGGSNVIR